jgi:hypothetical protein
MTTSDKRQRVSEAPADQARRQRGRPAVWPLPQPLADQFPNVKSERQKRKIAQRLHAMSVLLEDERFRWLCDPAAMRAGRDNSWRPEILSALGLIGDESAIKDVAKRICELKPTTKEAIKIIQRWRGAPLAAGDPWELMLGLLRGVDAYCAGRQMSDHDVLKAINFAADVVRTRIDPRG